MAQPKQPKQELTPRRRAAILMQSLPEEVAVEAMKHMPPEMVHQVTQEIVRVGTIYHHEMEDVVNSFFQESAQLSGLGGQSIDYLREMLVKVVGEDRANAILEDILDTESSAKGIDALNLLEPSSVAEMIRDEHPQIIATILVHLDRTQATDVLELLDERLRADVIFRIANFSGVQPTALEELTEVLTRMLEGQNVKRRKMGGVKAAAEMMNLLSTASEEAAIAKIKTLNEDLAAKIMDNMFVFSNIAELDDTAIRRIIRDVPQQSLVIALRGADDELVARFTDNLTERAARMMRDEMKARGPLLFSKVEAEQKAILSIVRRLVESGEIQLATANDSYV